MTDKTKSIILIAAGVLLCAVLVAVSYTHLDVSKRQDELNALDGKGTARQLIESGSGTITPYGVVYDNGMKLEPVSYTHLHCSMKRKKSTEKA